MCESHTWKHDKDHYRDMTLPGGFRWTGYDSDSGLHMFERRAIEDPFHWESVLVTDDDLENLNVVWMTEHGYTP